MDTATISTPRLDFTKAITDNMVSADSANAAKVNTARDSLINYYKSLPTLTDTYTGLRESTGLNQQENLVNSITKNIMNTQSSIDQLEPAVKIRMGDFNVNDAKRASILARERAPLQTNLTDLLRSKEYESIGLDQKNSLVSQLFSLTQADQERGARPLQLGVDYSTSDREIAMSLLQSVASAQTSAFSGDVAAQETRDENARNREFQAQQAAAAAATKSAADNQNFAQAIALENLKSSNDMALKKTVGAGTATEYMRLGSEQSKQAAEDSFNNIVASSSTASEVLTKIKANAADLQAKGIDVNTMLSLYSNLAARVGENGSIRSGDKLSQFKDALMNIPYKQ